MDTIEGGRSSLMQTSTSKSNKDQESTHISIKEPGEFIMESNDDAELNEIEQKTRTVVNRKPPVNPEQVPEVASLPSVGGTKSREEIDKEEGAPISPELVKAAIQSKPSTFEPKRHEKLPSRALNSRGRAQRASKALVKFEKKNRMSKHAQEYLGNDGSLPDSINIQDNRSHDESSISSGTKSHKSDPKRTIYLSDDYNFTSPTSVEQSKADFIFDNEDYQEQVMKEVSLEDMGHESSQVVTDKYGIVIPPNNVNMNAADKYMFDTEARPKSFSMAMNDYVVNQIEGDDENSFEAFENEPPPNIMPPQPSSSANQKMSSTFNPNDENGGLLDRVSTHLRSSIHNARKSVFGIEEEDSGQADSSHNDMVNEVENEVGLFFQRHSDTSANNSDSYEEPPKRSSEVQQSYFSDDLRIMYDSQSIPTEENDATDGESGIFRVYQSRKEWISRKHRKEIFIMAFVAIAVISLALVFGKDDTSDGNEPISDITSPSRSKPGRPTPRTPPEFTVGPELYPNAEPYSSNRVIALIEEAMQGTIDDPNSHQGKALKWIIQDAVGNPPGVDYRVIQRYGLATFYFATVSGSKKWENADNWLSVEHECTWHGVLCGPDGSLSFPETSQRRLETPLSDRVTYLALNENKLHGSIPDEIFLLSDLAQLHLYGNFLGESVPASLGRLKRLHTAYLDNNFFTGSLPRKIGELPLLMNMDISKNSMTGAIPDVFSNLNQLKNLRLDDNNFSGTFPSSLAQVGTLEVLTLGNNDLQGELPQDMSQLSKLGVIQLHENELSGKIPDFASPYLEEINLDNNRFTGLIPTIRDTANLRELRLESNQLSGTIPVGLGDHYELQRLWLDHNQLSGPVPHELGRLEELRSLRLHGNSLSGTVPSSVCSLREVFLDTFQATCEGNSDLECSCCTRC